CGAIADPGQAIAVHAVDLNQAALERAARARYSAWALRETSPAIQQQWFRPAGRQFDLCEAARSSVTFAQGNLAEPDCRWWQPAAYDVVFCRNVLMYFTLAQARAAIARIALALKPGGYLFLGHAETLRGLADGFALCQAHGAFYYHRAPGPTADRRMPQAPPAAALAHPRRQPPVGKPATGAQFGEPPTPVPALPSQPASSADTLLTEALLLTQRGRLAAAEDACRGLLAIDRRNAGAYYLLALCRESAGDCGGAAVHDQTAAGLDPGFAMPHLHLGLLARRVGDRDAARRELCRALDLLRHEDDGRLVLFGGGFTRGALVDLCGAALRQCGGPS
ncbi:MAG: CheR family methyltransferase, partial [Stellaceae bacterium]